MLHPLVAISRYVKSEADFALGVNPLSYDQFGLAFSLPRESFNTEMARSVNFNGIGTRAPPENQDQNQ